MASTIFMISSANNLEKLTLTLNASKLKIAEFANSADSDEVAHNEPPHQNLHCLQAIFFEFSI